MRRYTEEEKEEILKAVKIFGNVSLVAKKQGMPSTTLQNWLKKGLQPSKPSQIRELKKIISEQALKISILKDLLKKNTEFFRKKSHSRVLYSVWL
ncbi:MAG: hypothetical protein OXJ52_03295 [Oligoflexia bacterium]|nr:hypothetical protein [Oligoflexia bacterium]